MFFWRPGADRLFSVKNGRQGKEEQHEGGDGKNNAYDPLHRTHGQIGGPAVLL